MNDIIVTWPINNSTQNLPGTRYGRLVIMSYWRIKTKHRTDMYCFCRCSCNNIKFVRRLYLRKGESISCGCFRSDKTTLKNTMHGLSKHHIYIVWNDMKARCYNPKDKSFHNYGQRGIKICKRWMKFKSFAEDMLPSYKKGYSLERINNNAGYFPENCKWATTIEQMNNMRSNNKITFREKTLTMAQWARKFKINYGTLKKRIYMGWPIERALTEIVHKI